MKRTPKPQVQFNWPLLPVLLGVAIFLQLVAPYQGWLVLIIGLGGAWLISYLWVRSLAQGLTLQREIRSSWAQVGDYLEERFVLNNRGWARALGVEVLDHSNLPDYGASRVVGVDSHNVSRWETHGVCTRRGLFTLGPTGIRAGDPLGLFTVTLEYANSTSLIVTPRIVHLPTIQVAPGGRTDAGRRRTKTYEPTVSAVGVQDYFPGASLKTIHWPTSARRDSLYVRLFDSNPAGDWWIYLDLDRRVQAGQGPNSTEEHSIVLAASLADRGLKAGRAVGLVAQGKSLVWLPPRLGDEQRWQILRALALVESGPEPLSHLLAQTKSNLGQRASLIVITPAVHGDWLDTLFPIMQRGVIPTILLLDPISFDTKVNLNNIEGRLTQLEISHYLITRDLLDSPEYAPPQPESDVVNGPHLSQGRRASP